MWASMSVDTLGQVWQACVVFRGESFLARLEAQHAGDADMCRTALGSSPGETKTQTFGSVFIGEVTERLPDSLFTRHVAMCVFLSMSERGKRKTARTGVFFNKGFCGFCLVTEEKDCHNTV
jgi:hypothetical protein